MEYYNGIRAIAARDYYHAYADGLGKGEIVKENYVSYITYKTQVSKGKINVLRKAHGEGNYALIELASIPKKYRERIVEAYSGQAERESAIDFGSYLEKDLEAFAFFTSYRYEDGTAIPTSRVDNITLWGNGASCLNAIEKVLQRHNELRMRASRKATPSVIYNDACKWLHHDRLLAEFAHNLPSNPRSLRRKHELYKKLGYEAMIKKLKGNSNARLITDKLLGLLIDIAAMPNNPYTTRVVEIYKLFMEGIMEIVNLDSGELYNPADYFKKDGSMVEVSADMLKYYLNQPKIQAVLDRKRMGFKNFNDMHRPHRMRHKPNYSLSKVSFDDRDLVFKDRESKKRVKAYYAYDALSGCVIGASYSRKKDEQLFLDCLFDMFVFCERNGMGIPLEVEFEHHLVKQFEPELKRLFPMVHFCAAGNSQEKRAEHFNRIKKYGVEKNNHRGIGRFYLKSRHNRIGIDKVNDEFKEILKPYDELVANDVADCMEYNNQPHKDYPGMTRMEVLLANLNPNLLPLDKSYIYRYIGFETETSIRRSMYVQTQGARYMLPHPNVLERLNTNRAVKAYWMPNKEGEIEEIHVYQHDEFVCTCKKVVYYNEAQAERTEADWLAKLEQDKYVAKFDKMIKDELGGIDKLEVIDTRKRKVAEVQKVELVESNEEFDKPITESVGSYADKAIADMLGF